ncbi:MAG: Ldh family oxidoreductase [Chloroflexi bacterium]|nr:Ldh family oxidoreductase [Chloroflexota bacterium]
MVHITDGRLRALVTAIFEAAGAPSVVAQQVAESLVLASLVGHDSHGVRAIAGYIEALENGTVDPRGEIAVVRESATTALLDGGRNFGIMVMHKALDLAMSKAHAHDLGMVAIRNSGHTGRLGEYVVRAAENGFMGLVFGTGAQPGGTVAPYLGASPRFNSNPIAWGVPAAQHPPVFIDYATSACAVAKLMLAADKGVPIPEGWLLGPDGNPSTDPLDWQRGGALLPFGGHKGYGLMFLIELLSGGLSGMSCAPLPDYQPAFSAVVMAVNISAFQPLEEFRQRTDRLVAATKEARKLPGVQEILVPGEPEWQTFEKRRRDGLDLLDVIWQRIVEAGARHGITVTP